MPLTLSPGTDTTTSTITTEQLEEMFEEKIICYDDENPAAFWYSHSSGDQHKTPLCDSCAEVIERYAKHKLTCPAVMDHEKYDACPVCEKTGIGAIYVKPMS